MFSADTLQQALVQDYGRLCTLANKILQDSHLAQDAVQESWLRLNRARPDTTDAEKLRHLLLVTVRHTALNMAEPAGRTGRRCSICRPAGCWPAAAGKAGTQRGRALPAGGNAGAGRNRPRHLAAAIRAGHDRGTNCGSTGAARRYGAPA